MELKLEFHNPADKLPEDEALVIAYMEDEMDNFEQPYQILTFHKYDDDAIEEMEAFKEPGEDWRPYYWNWAEGAEPICGHPEWWAYLPKIEVAEKTPAGSPNS